MKRTTIDNKSLQRILREVDIKHHSTGKAQSPIITKTWLNRFLDHFNISYDNERVLEYLDSFPLYPKLEFEREPPHRNKQTQIDNTSPYVSVYNFCKEDIGMYHKYFADRHVYDNGLAHVSTDAGNKQNWHREGLGRYVYKHAVQSGVRIEQEWVINKQCWINRYPVHFLKILFNELDAQINLTMYQNIEIT